MIKEKKCTKCKEIKLIKEFSKDRYRKDGLCCQCKQCRKVYQKEWQQANPEYSKQHYKEHPNYYIQYRKTNKLNKRLWASEYIQSERGKMLHRAGNRRRRASKWKAKGSHTVQDVLKQGDSQEWLCYWQGPDCEGYCKDNYHVDHYLPLSRGGSNWPENVVISCPTCNLQKHDKTPDEFKKYIERLTNKK